MNKDSDLSIFLATYGRSFARTAYLLTGDPDRARTLAIDALTSIGRRWSSVRRNQPAHAVLRELYRRYLSAGAPPPQAPEAYALGPLPPKARAALVSRFHDGLPPQQAAVVTGLWSALLEQEARQARDHLYATHLSLFPVDPPPAPAPEKAPEGEAAPKAPPQTSWAAPSPDPAGSQAKPAAAPWTAPSRAWDQPAEGDDPDLRGALTTIADGMPDSHADIAATVLRRVTRRRRLRVVMWSTVSLHTVVVFAAMITVVLNSVAAGVETAFSEPTSAFDRPTPFFDYTPPPDDVPDPLPATLREPVQYAYQGFCQGAVQGGGSTDPQPCAQWRLTTVSGDEWRLVGARAGWDPWRLEGAAAPLAISPDGHRVAYRTLAGPYVVRDLPTGVVKTISVPYNLATPEITVSPNGRYFSVCYGDSTAATLDFDKDRTLYDDAEGIEILAVSDDGTRVVREKEDVQNVRGHPSVSKLFMNGPGGLVGDYRIDAALTEYGGALSPDGRTLALVTADLKLVTMDARTGRVGKRRTDVGDYEVIRVERWIGRDEVLVRRWDDDYVLLTKVDVRTGATEELDAELSESLGYDSPLGALGP